MSKLRGISNNEVGCLRIYHQRMLFQSQTQMKKNKKKSTSEMKKERSKEVKYLPTCEWQRWHSDESYIFIKEVGFNMHRIRPVKVGISNQQGMYFTIFGAISVYETVNLSVCCPSQCVFFYSRPGGQLLVGILVAFEANDLWQNLL